MDLIDKTIKVTLEGLDEINAEIEKIIKCLEELKGRTDAEKPMSETRK